MPPLVRALGVISTRTLSPVRTRIRFLRIFPAVCAIISWSFSSLTRKVAFGSNSTTVPGNSSNSSFDICFLEFRPPSLRGGPAKLFRADPNRETCLCEPTGWAFESGLGKVEWRVKCGPSFPRLRNRRRSGSGRVSPPRGIRRRVGVEAADGEGDGRQINQGQADQHFHRKGCKQENARGDSEKDGNHIFARHAANPFAGKMRDTARHQECYDQHIRDFERNQRTDIGNRENREIEIKRQEPDYGARRRGHAGEEMRLPRRPVRIVDHDIEAGEAQRRRDRENERREPAETLYFVQPPKIKDERRSDSESDEIGEGVEFGAEPRGAAQRAREASVQSIENGGDNDRDDGGFELTLNGEPDCGEAHAQRQQGDEIG